MPAFCRQATNNGTRPVFHVTREHIVATCITKGAFLSLTSGFEHRIWESAKPLCVVRFTDYKTERVNWAGGFSKGGSFFSCHEGYGEERSAASGVAQQQVR